MSGCASTESETKTGNEEKVTPGCVTVGFKLDQNYKPTDIRVIDSNPPGLYDNLGIESVKKTKPPAPPPGYADKLFIVTINVTDKHNPHASVPKCRASAPSAATNS